MVKKSDHNIKQVLEELFGLDATHSEMAGADKIGNLYIDIGFKSHAAFQTQSLAFKCGLKRAEVSIVIPENEKKFIRCVPGTYFDPKQKKTVTREKTVNKSKDKEAGGKVHVSASSENLAVGGSLDAQYNLKTKTSETISTQENLVGLNIIRTINSWEIWPEPGCTHLEGSPWDQNEVMVEIQDKRPNNTYVAPSIKVEVTARVSDFYFYEFLRTGSMLRKVLSPEKTVIATAHMFEKLKDIGLVEESNSDNFGYHGNLTLGTSIILPR